MNWFWPCRRQWNDIILENKITENEYSNKKEEGYRRISFLSFSEKRKICVILQKTKTEVL